MTLPTLMQTSSSDYHSLPVREWIPRSSRYEVFYDHKGGSFHLQDGGEGEGVLLWYERPKKMVNFPDRESAKAKVEEILKNEEKERRYREIYG